MPRKPRVTTVLFRLGRISVRKRKTDRGTFRLYLDIRTEKRIYDFAALTGLELTGVAIEDRETVEVVRTIVLERNKELIAARNGIEYYSPKRLDADFIAYFEQVAEKRQQKTWSNTLVHLRRYAGKSIVVPFRLVDASWLEDFQEYLLRTVAETSAHTYFSTIKAALNQAVKDKILLQNPSTDVQNIKRKDRVRAFLTIDEVRTLAKVSCRSDVVKRAFLFSCFTGLRLSDVKALTWAQIRSDGWLEVVQEKTGRANYVPLHESASQILGDRRDNKVTVFPLLGDEHTRKTIKKWVKDAGIEKSISFHNARHTFATLMEQANGNIYTTSSLLGHSSVSTTQGYAKIVDETKRKAIEKIPGL